MAGGRSPDGRIREEAMTGSDARVQSVKEEHLDLALPLMAGYQRFYGVQEPDDERNRGFFEGFLAPSERGLLLGAWDGEALVGFACLYFTHSSIHAQEVVLLSDLFVAPGRRGGGFGRALIEAAVDVARNRGARHLEWLTAIDNREAQRLYERVGAERSAWFGYEILTGPA
jgi:GNAT superfamily N-acetyltransferase